MTQLALETVEHADLLPEFQDFFSRLADRVNSGAILKDLPTWICRNTFLKGRPWSFKDHEFQIAIARDQAQKKVVKKCSQVGLTELQIRLALAYLRVSNGRSLMYVLPYSKMAIKVSKSRIEPVIDSSPALSKSIIAGSNSAEYKRIGNSHLYIGGADKATDAISSPLDRLIVDERDFCRERVLGIYSSRMRHTEDGEAMTDEFSTPTISGYGICAGYERSDQKRYLVKCIHCNQQQAPDFLKQIVIPGFDKEFQELDREDFTLHRYEFNKSYIKCEKCGKELDSSLMVADRRQWVAKYPGREISGYAVKPYDLYKYNSTPRVIEQFPSYPLLQDFYNFVLGEELDTNDNKINDGIVSKCFTGEFIRQKVDGVCVGIDVGKNVHVMVQRREHGKYCVLGIYKLRFTDGDMAGQLSQILDSYGFTIAVIDAAPDISLPKALQDKYGIDRIHPCYYVAGKKTESVLYTINEDTGNVNAVRTKGFDHMVKAINNFGYVFPRVEDVLEKEVREHFQQIARKEEYNDEGEKQAKWVKLSDMDHFFHACFYSHLAAQILDTDYSAGDSVAPVGIVGGAVGSTAYRGAAAAPQSVAAALRTFGFGIK